MPNFSLASFVLGIWVGGIMVTLYAVFREHKGNGATLSEKISVVVLTIFLWPAVLVVVGYDQKKFRSKRGSIVEEDDENETYLYK
jgi:hypothetical protein